MLRILTVLQRNLAMNALRLAFNRDPFTLDPQKCSDVVSSAAIFLLFRGLTRLDANHKITYDLAESIQISKDLRTYIFHLKEARWSDGEPLTAYDFEKSWKRALHPSFPARSLDFFFSIKNAEKAKHGELSLDDVGIHAKNAKTLVITLEQANTNFLKYTCFCPLFPIPTHIPMEEKYMGSVVSGPFKLIEWKKGCELYMEKNPHSSVLLDAVRIRIIKAPKEAYELFENGEIDWIGDPLCSLPIHRSFPSRKTKCVSQISCCSFNTEKYPFHNESIRKAFTYAIDRAQIIQTLQLPDSFPTTGLIPPTLKKYAKNKSFFKDADLALAKELFQKGQEELGRDLSDAQIRLSFEDNEMRWELAKMLQSFWQNAFPVKIQLEPLEFRALHENFMNRNYCLGIFRWLIEYSDPLNILFMFKDQKNPRNYSGWSSQEYMKVLDGYVKTNELEKRMKFLKKAETMISENMPLAPIFFSHFSYLEQPYLKGVTISSIGTVQFDQAFIDQSLTISA